MTAKSNTFLATRQSLQIRIFAFRCKDGRLCMGDGVAVPNCCDSVCLSFSNMANNPALRLCCSATTTSSCFSGVTMDNA